MIVEKRDGRIEDVSFDKITKRINFLSEMDPPLNIDSTIVSQKVCSEIYNGVKTTELDILSSEISVAILDNLDYRK